MRSFGRVLPQRHGSRPRRLRALLARIGSRILNEVGRRWSSSLSFRVSAGVISLSAVGILVLGFVLQTQIAEQLMRNKAASASAQAETLAVSVQRNLSAVEANGLGELNNAAAAAASEASVSDQSDIAANGFTILIVAPSGSLAQSEVATGDVGEIAPDLRAAVQRRFVASKIYQIGGTPTYVVGQPIDTASRGVEFYVLFPLTAEQRTLGLVQGTLGVGGLIILMLMAGIAILITRQVVHPVRLAAEIAERFADGHLDERLPVHGNDELARLGESYNRMASSLQMQISQLEEFGSLQRRFTSDVSHELRTPLTTVRMAADVLYASREELLPALRRSSELLVNELDRFEALLADLLEISRLDAGVADLAAESTDMAGVVSRAVEAVRGLAEDTGTPLELSLPGGVYAEVDPRRVERIVRNLVANAVDHGESRPVCVELAADDTTVAVVVRDHGVGLRPGEAGLVFNRFWRAEESRARRTGGTGLGLSIAVEDAHLHGGWLQAWGEVGTGAVFRLTLPRTVGDTVTSSPLPLGPETAPGPVLAGSVPTPPLGWPALPQAAVNDQVGTR